MTIRQRKKFKKRALRRQLENGGKIIPDDFAGTEGSHSDRLDQLDRRCEEKRCGCEVHLIVQPSSSVSPERHPKLPLVKAVACASTWYEKVIQGQAPDVRSLAQEAGLTERYVGKVFRGCGSSKLHV